MEIIRIGKGIESLTVKQLVDILKYAKNNEPFPSEYHKLLEENIEISSDLRNLRLADVHPLENPELLDLGSKVLEYYESRMRPQAPVEFARQMAKIYENSRKV